MREKLRRLGRFKKAGGRLFVLAYFVLMAAWFVPVAVNLAIVDDAMGIRVDENVWLNFDESAALVRKWTRIVDDIEASGWRPVFDDASMLDWMSEVAPMFEYEGLVTETRDGFQGFVFSFSAGFAHNHIAGRSDCLSFVILNYRFRNPISSWYEKGWWPATLVHEVAHVQQGPACDQDGYSKALLENTAQLMSWEVLAALANQGSPEATLTLVYELRGTALGAAMAMARYEDRIDDYEKLFYDLFGDNEGRVARHEKGNRFWVDRQDELQRLLMRYNWDPLNRVFKARYEQTIYQLAIDNETHSMEIDDLTYFMRHMEELVEWALENVDEKE